MRWLPILHMRLLTWVGEPLEAQPVADHLNHKGEATRLEIALTSNEQSEATVGSKETPRDIDPP